MPKSDATFARLLQALLPQPIPFVLLGAALLAFVIYGVLPFMGISQFGYLLSLSKLLILVIALVGVPGYIMYWRWLVQTPSRALIGMLVGFPLSAHFADQLMRYAGVNLRFRWFGYALFIIPSLWVIFRHRQLFWQHTKRLMPIRIYGTFLAVLLVFAFVNNHFNADIGLMGPGLWDGDSLAVRTISSHINVMIVMALGWILCTETQAEPLFTKAFGIVRALCIMSAITCAYTLIGIPLGLTTAVIEGYTRATGIFNHPNPLAHHTGILTLLFLSIYLFCQHQQTVFQAQASRSAPQVVLGNKAQPLPAGSGFFAPWRQGVVGKNLMWLVIGLVANIIVLLIGLSKTAIAVTAAGMALMFVLCSGLPTARKLGLTIGGILVAMIPVGILAYNLITGQDFMDTVNARLEDTNSLTWRENVWAYLESQIEGANLFTGHGFLAANESMFQYLFNAFDEDLLNPVILVHNGYLNLLYDFGLWGLIYFAGILWLLLQQGALYLAAWGHNNPLAERLPLVGGGVAMAFYFSFGARYDELVTMFDACFLFWFSVTMVFWLASMPTNTLQTVASTENTSPQPNGLIISQRPSGTQRT